MAASMASVKNVSTPQPTTWAIPLFGWPLWISAAAAVMSGVASGLTLFVPDVLRGPAVMNGSGRGTALVALFVAVPTLAGSMVIVSRGAVRPVISWLGATAYLLYNSVLFLLITPFNQLFLLYVAMFALSFWNLVAVLRAMDVPAFARRYGSRFPARAIAVVLAVIATLNALAWLRNVVPAVFSTASPQFLAGTGLTTNPIYVQDLSFWIPLTFVSSVWLWQKQAWGFVNVGALLVFGLIESIGIAVDQWMGSAADPASTVASAVFTPIFAAVAAVTLIPLFFYFKNLASGRR